MIGSVASRVTLKALLRTSIALLTEEYFLVTPIVRAPCAILPASVCFGVARPSSTGFYDNHYSVSKEPEFLKQHVNLPTHFAANGYKTLSSGKIFHTGGYFQVQGPRAGQWRQGLDQKVHHKPKGMAPHLGFRASGL